LIREDWEIVKEKGDRFFVKAIVYPLGLFCISINLQLAD
jgi:hypothetical protein